MSEPGLNVHGTCNEKSDKSNPFFKEKYVQVPEEAKEKKSQRPYLLLKVYKIWLITVICIVVSGVIKNALL